MNSKMCPFCGGVAILDREFRFVGYGFIRRIFARILKEPDIWGYYYRCVSCAAQGGWAKNIHGAWHNWDMRVGETE